MSDHHRPDLWEKDVSGRRNHDEQDEQEEIEEKEDQGEYLKCS
jgi:hypothetical protein